MYPLETATGQSRLLIIILAVVDVLLLAVNVIHWRLKGSDDPVFANPAWDGDLDQSYIEIFGHILLIAAIVMLIALLRRRVVMVMVVWVVILVALVADDLLMIHERVGTELVGLLGLPAMGAVRAQDLGELLVWAAMIVPLGILLLIGHLRANPADRRDSRRLLLLVALLAAFAVVLDTVSHPLGELVPLQIGTLITLTETAGELISMTLITIVVHRMTLRPEERQESDGVRGTPSSVLE